MSRGKRGKPNTTADQNRQDTDAAYLEEIGYRPNTNQLRHEEMPASHHAPQRLLAVVRNEEAAAAHAQRNGVQVAGAEDDDVPDSGNQRPKRASRVSNAVPGKPDGEVDTGG